MVSIAQRVLPSRESPMLVAIRSRRSIAQRQAVDINDEWSELCDNSHISCREH